MASRAHVDRTLFFTLLALVIGGFFIFLSASLGLLAYDGASFSQVALSQIVLGLGGGLIAAFIAAKISYRFWRKFSLYLFIAAFLGTLLVFVPHIGITLNGAKRWITFGPITVQPSEFLKIAYILYLATWLSSVKSKIQEINYGLFPFGCTTALTAFVLILEHDTSTLLVVGIAGIAMLWSAGAPLRDFFIIALVTIAVVGALAIVRPYVAQRLTTFLHPGNDPTGSSYQIQQSLLAVGAGELFGRGFGQSIQKFGKVPEPISDSIFSVFSEEFGFLGAATLIVAYVVFAMRGLWIAARSPDLFGGLLAVGIVVLITVQSFINIGSMIGVFPLSGLPLVFISHGGSALLVSLGAAGLLLSVSRTVHA